MCNKVIECSEESTLLQIGSFADLEHRPGASGMDNPSLHPTSPPPNCDDKTPRVKFLCSFSGCILPRPQDGKLRYVGGETRIISVPRNISYEELMARMRELYEGASILKYQQPDEDLDALVSVVNDDDVINMMEEYDKLGSGDGFTRLRIFLFSQNEQDASPHYIDGDERDTERRYVDALNSLNESPEYRSYQFNDSPVMSPAEEAYIADHFVSSMNLDGSIHNQRNYEIPTSHYNLRHLVVPNVGLGQHSASIPQRYGDDLQWSPAHGSPRCFPQDLHPAPEVPSSPSIRYHKPIMEISDRGIDRLPEEYSRLQVNHLTGYDHLAPYSENVVWLPTGSSTIDNSGFPGNMLQQTNVFDGTNPCQNCRMPIHRNQLPADNHWRYEDKLQMEQPGMHNGVVPVVHPCVDCPPNREAVMLNPDPKFQHGIYNKDQSDSQSLCGDAQTSDRGRAFQHPLYAQAEEPRAHISQAGRGNEHYILDGVGMNYPVTEGCDLDVHHIAHSHVHCEDPWYVRAGCEQVNEVFPGQASASCSHVQVPAEERGVHHVNLPCSYGLDKPYPLSHGHPSMHTLYRNTPLPVYMPSTYVTSTVHPRHAAAGSGLPVGTVGADQNPLVESSHVRVGIDGSSTPEYARTVAGTNLNSNVFYPENQQTLDCAWNSPNVLPSAVFPVNHMNMADSAMLAVGNQMISSTPKVSNLQQGDGIGNSALTGLGEQNIFINGKEISSSPVEGSGVQVTHNLEENDKINAKSDVGSLVPAMLSPVDVGGDAVLLGDQDNTKDMSFLPDLVASVNEAKLETTEVVKARAQENLYDNEICDASSKVTEADTTAANADERGQVMRPMTSECGSDNDSLNASKIEPTQAEEEAISRGLQTIRNDDLEEIRELGCGTYGSVFHGKWKGSDVAIKRIKASCFSGRSSDRERLITDFWKEALLLSSLHHPNVVSFYGVVRDGPDGSLATVTEFMVNGSLKQYLQKKDRTIDRRKRLIIAMDAAFGMEYLHGKNIVHFDLKCENLLVNMRDPHRPICKIGDLGLSKVKQHTLVSGGVRGTLPWMAPELLSGKSNMVTEKIDVYSFGIVMWELLTGDEPYKEMHCASIIGGIVNNSLRPEIPAWCDPEWKALMRSCWGSDPSERPSFTEISQKLRSMAAAMNVK